MAEGINEIMDEYFENAFRKKNVYAQIGTVSNIDKTARTCDFTPIEGDAKRTGIRLQASVSGAVGIVTIPVDGSFVVVNFFDEQKGFVSLTEEVDEHLIDATLTQFNGGSNDGLININDLVTSVNTIENKLEAFITLFNAHIHITTATIGAGPTPGVLVPTVPPQSALGQVSVKGDWEDTKVTH